MQQPDFAPLAAKISYLSEGDTVDVRHAYDFAVKAHEGQMREDGSPYVLHVIAVAEIMALWHGDIDALVASLLHDSIEDTAVRKEDIAEHFGRKAALLVEGITKFTKADLSADLPLDRKIETLRKLFDVMRIDIRSILIKLADRLHNVRTIDSLPTPERRRRFALETLNVYYKIAYHLGMRELRRHFAEHCVPHAFDDGSDCRRKRDMLCLSAAHIVPVIEKELKKNEDNDRIVNVFFTPRNLLVFREKSLARGGNPLLQDAFSVSVIVRTEEDCYHLLKTLHTLYRPVSGQFRDFIAAPSDSGYRSLHTHVTLRDGIVINMRVYTPEMYEQSMLGLPQLLFRSHSELPSAFDWLKRTESLDLLTRESSGAFWEALESDILRETISVIVDRRRMSLPRGATALDAAYALHDERAASAGKLMVNGRTVPGREILREDDDVHVTLEQGSLVTFDWLQMICTRHARLLIVEALKRTDKTEKISLGASLLQKELDHYNKGLLSEFSRHQCESAATHFRRETFDQVLSMIGEGVIRARDVVFFLFPDRGSDVLLKKSEGYAFRLYITAIEQEDQDVLSELQTVLQDGNVSARSIRIRESRDGSTAGIYLSGTCADRLAFADFVESLERQEWVSKTETMLSAKQRAFVIFLFAFAFGVMLLDIVLLGRYGTYLAEISSTAAFLAYALPLIPILLTNYYILSVLRSYVLRLRRERWYFGLGFFLNVFGIFIVVWKTPMLQTEPSVLFVLFIFACTMLLMGYHFVQTYLQFDTFMSSSAVPKLAITTGRQRLIGYLLRFGAVFIWGIEPVVIRYTPMQQLSPLLRVNIWAVAGAISGLAAIFLLNFFHSKEKRMTYATPYNRYFAIIVLANLSYNYFLHKSLLFTTATNVNLVLSYAPIFALILGFVIWRDRIAYFRTPHSVQQMFMIFALSAMGGTLLMYNNFNLGNTGVVGDLLALLIAFSDVAFIMSNIHYLKYSNHKTNTISLATHHFLWIAIVTFALIAIVNVFGIGHISFAIPAEQLIPSVAVGVLTLIGLVLTFEAFKRIDGLLAFLMLNLAPFIAFTAEIIFIGTHSFTFVFILGGMCIVSASVFAEIVHIRCQRLGAE